jgi:hypothetical protein
MPKNEGKNTEELAPNYSRFQSVNMVYNSPSLGKPAADRVQRLIDRGVSDAYICSEFNAALIHVREKDTMSQVRALAAALDNLEHNIREAAKIIEEQAKNPDRSQRRKLMSPEN